MKATRQLLSLCLVIGMTTASYAVPFSPPDSKGVPASFTKDQPYLSHAVNSGSGSKFLSRYSNTTTSLCIGNAFMFGWRRLLKS